VDKHAESAINQTLIYGTHECRRWRAEIFVRHSPIAKELAAGFIRQARLNPIDPNTAGNTWLRETIERLRFGHRKLSALIDDDEISQLAERNAKSINQTYIRLSGCCSFDAVIERLKQRVEAEDVPWPAGIKSSDSTSSKQQKHAGAVARARDPRWWRRALRKVIARKVESVLRESGAICKRRAPYVSDVAFARWQTTQRRNRNTMQNLIALSNEGDELPLQECIDSSISNPINRRNELMVRMRGWETIADSLNLQGVMLTLTAPSQFHSYHYSGEFNSKYNSSNPIETIAYLNGVWSRIRSAWHRVGIKSIGFRICEPHHDGTPHFHFLLFFPPPQWQIAWSIFRQHALSLDGDEHGAAEHRCNYRLIDKTIGSATGYVAKYVAKNIDGYGFSKDELDQESDIKANDGAARVRAWASLWGIRQFQQIGSISVSVYRELRRLAVPLIEQPEKVEIARVAADRGDWAAFVDAMGGAFIRREEQLLRPLKQLAEKLGRYGDEIRRILGLVMQATANQLLHHIQTRTKTWEIVPLWKLKDIRERGSPYPSCNAPPPHEAAGKAVNRVCGGPSQKVRSTI